MRCYPYVCSECGHEFDVYKNLIDIDRGEVCLKCGQELDSSCRVIARNQHFFGAAVEDAEYNPAFGKVIKNKAEARMLAKQHGMIEVGNEDFGKYQKQQEKDRQADIDRKWDNA